ncbi:hypothetical protein [Portibacter marinus]|uniref:hypothetical protein n=1 Tax=Portibacter marinus TaxID=2898660 RepID=UPI001F3FD0DF|nr:hypothetical protein [Portibacter marinus]
MMQSYTELDLLRFIYKEVEVCEYFEMDFAINEDPNLHNDYEALKATVDQLPKVKFEPSAISIQNILGYAVA